MEELEQDLIDAQEIVDLIRADTESAKAARDHSGSGGCRSLSYSNNDGGCEDEEDEDEEEDEEEDESAMENLEALLEAAGAYD